MLVCHPSCKGQRFWHGGRCFLRVWLGQVFSRQTIKSSRFLTNTGTGNGARAKASVEKTSTISLPFVQRTIEVGTGFPTSKALRRVSCKKVSNAVFAAHCGSTAEFRCQPCCSDWTRYVRRWSRSCVKISVDSNLRSWYNPVRRSTNCNRRTLRTLMRGQLGSHYYNGSLCDGTDFRYVGWTRTSPRTSVPLVY